MACCLASEGILGGVDIGEGVFAPVVIVKRQQWRHDVKKANSELRIGAIKVNTAHITLFPSY